MKPVEYNPPVFWSVVMCALLLGFFIGQTVQNNRHKNETPILIVDPAPMLDPPPPIHRDITPPTLAEWQTYRDRDRLFFDAMRITETGGFPDPSKAVGDNGKSFGPYQIGKSYFIDSRVRNSKWPDDILDAGMAEQVMVMYWRRWCPTALASRDYETLARVHNGGPRGAEKSATDVYWGRVKFTMSQLEKKQ